MKEIITTGKTVDLAIEEACQKLGAARDVIEFEIIDLPKKGFLGLKCYPAKVKVIVKEDKAQTAVDFVRNVLLAMGAKQFTLDSKVNGENLLLTLKGEDLGFVIGRRGETIDAIQYLAGLAINKIDGDYMRITIDSGNFREKRERTLESLARRLARTAVKSCRSVTLEPMNPYERRIIHSTVSSVEGATSSSIGEEPNRRVVITPKGGDKKPTGSYKSSGRSTENTRPLPPKKPTETTKAAGQGWEEDKVAKPFVFRPNTNTKADFANRNEQRSDNRKPPYPARPREVKPWEPKQFEDSAPRTEVPHSQAPKEAEDKPLYAKVDLD